MAVLGTLQNLRRKFTGPAPIAATVSALIPFRRDWKKTVLNANQQTAETEERKRALIDRRSVVAIAAIEGDAQATRQCDVLDGQIAELDRHLSRLKAARDGAQARVNAETAEKIEADYAAYRAEVAERRAAVQAAAEALDARTAALAEALVDFGQAGADLIAAARTMLVTQEVRDLHIEVATRVDTQLQKSGFGFKGAHFVTDCRIAPRVQSPEYFMGLLPPNRPD